MKFLLGSQFPYKAELINDTENWSNQEHYNTYNYLMNRNEDARASYIKTFVQGLYEI